jgi:hypothetical protein
VIGPPRLRRLKPHPLVVGVDPGFAGAIGVLDITGAYVDVLDMPVTGGTGRDREIDPARLAEIIYAIGRRGPIHRVLLEWPQTRPDEAPEASKRFGVGLGLLEMGFTMVGVRPERVAPNKWKGRLGLMGKDGDSGQAREQAVRYAEQFIGRLPPGLLRGPRGGAKDGRAEALLIAWEAVTSTKAGLLALDPDTRMARLLFGGSRRRKGGGGVL